MPAKRCLVPFTDHWGRQLWSRQYSCFRAAPRHTRGVRGAGGNADDVLQYTVAAPYNDDGNGNGNDGDEAVVVVVASAASAGDEPNDAGAVVVSGIGAGASPPVAAFPNGGPSFQGTCCSVPHTRNSRRLCVCSHCTGGVEDRGRRCSKG